MVEMIGVGIIGASLGHWATDAHIPAIRALPAFVLRAISTTRQQSADAAAAHFGVPHAFDNHQDLIACPGVDLVVVTVKVPYHLELVSAALSVGKMVYCEWPLGNGLAEATVMADLARKKSVHAIVGLQSRLDPTIAYVRDVVREGQIGDVISTTLIGNGMAWAGPMPQSAAYLADAANGATMLSIPFAHSVDALVSALGEFESLNATIGQYRSSLTLLESGATIPMTAPDQIGVTGTLASGATASIQYRAGIPRGTKLLWEILGSEGELRITSDGGHMGMFPLHLSGGFGGEDQMKPLQVPALYHDLPGDGLPGPAANVTRIYANLAHDLQHGTQLSTSFDQAVVRHRMLHAIETAAASGTLQHYITAD